jgi:CubicO group peptidase (beta-lactamase class C family)
MQWLVRVFLFSSVFFALFQYASSAAGEDASTNFRTWTLNSELMPRPAEEGRPALLDDPELLRQFVQKHIRDRMSEAHIPGAVFLAVLDGEVIYKEGFGYEDLETRKPVSTETTMFRVASISKTFLGTTVMRSVDKGLLSLDDSIDELVPSIEISRLQKFNKPVTIRNSLTHSTGFRDLFLNSSAPSPEKFEEIRPVIRKYLTEQGAEVGEYTNYCNICISMTAAALEEVTGKSYADLLTEEVFEPLGMKYATLDIPINPHSESLKKYQVKQYVYDDDSGEFKLYGEFLRNLYPPSSIAISADEIAKYMIMHMNGGFHQGERFLSAESYAEMHRSQISHHEKISGYGISFKKGFANGIRYTGHSGDSRGNDSTMQFLPDYNFGFFLSYTGDQNAFYRDFINNFFNTAFPPQTETVTTEVKTPEEMKRFEGYYTNFRFDEPTPMQLVFPLFGQYKVSATKDGLLDFEYPSYYYKGGNAIYTQVEENLFRKVDNGEPNRIGSHLVDYLVFETGENGEGLAFKSNIQNHPFVMTRVPAWKKKENFQFLMSFSQNGLMAIVGISLLSLLWRLIGRFVLKRSTTTPILGSGVGSSLFLSAATGLGFLIAFFMVLMNTPPINLTYGFDDLGLSPYFVLPLISLLLFFAAALLLVRTWVGKQLSLLWRIVLTVALLPLSAWLFLAYKTHLLSYYFV